MTPNRPAGRPSIWRSQSRTTSSISVAAGAVFHSMALALKAAASASARTAGPGEEFAKYAKKPGWFQWVRPGTTIRSTSARIASSGSGPAGGKAGSASRISPGRTRESTG